MDWNENITMIESVEAHDDNESLDDERLLKSSNVMRNPETGGSGSWN